MPTKSSSEQGENAYAEAGHPFGLSIEGEGPPLLLVPGMDGTGRLFYKQVPLLSRHFRVGTFRLPDDAHHLDTMVAAVVEVVQAMSPSGEPVIVCGESFGGAMSLSLAARHPELVRALVILNSFSRFLPQHRLHAAVASLSVMPWGMMALVRRLTAFRMHSRFTHRAELRRFLHETRATTREGYLNRLRILMEYDARPHLANLPMPVLFLAADQDHLIPSVEQAEYMVSRVPRGSLRVLEGHGHVCLIAPNVDLAEILLSWEHLGVGPGEGRAV
ncbi:MAG: alpha/beta hydrolase [Gemmatimonadaceae bacterium]